MGGRTAAATLRFADLSSAACPSCAAGSTLPPRRPARTTTRWRPWSTTCAAASRTLADRGAGGDDRSIERHRERGKLPVRERIDQLARPGLGVPRAEPARGERPVRRRRARRGHRHRHRPGRGHDLRHRRQRRDRQGRHVLPDDGQEAPARPGDRPREPPAVHLPRRQRRRVPAAPGRRLPGPRPLRPDLLQPGPDVGRRASRRSRWSWARARPAAPTSRR